MFNICYMMVSLSSEMSDLHKFVKKSRKFHL